MIGKTLSCADGIRLVQGLVHILETGQPLPSGLHAIADEFERPQAANMVRSLSERISSGLSLSAAADEFKAILPPSLVRLLGLSLSDKKLLTGLRQFAVREELADELRRRMFLAIAYPAMVVLFLALWLLFMGRIVVTPVSQVVAREVANLPAAQNVASTMSLQTMLEPLAWGLLALVGIYGLALFATRSAKIDWFTERLPLIGPIYRAQQHVEFCSLLAQFIDLQVPLPTALHWTGEGLPFPGLRRRIEAVTAAVERGTSLSQSLAQQPGLESFAQGFNANLSDAPALASQLSALADSALERCRAECGFANLAAPMLAFTLLFTLLVSFVNALEGQLLNLVRLVVS
jgi:type II secretory pathway component PulF